MTQDVVQTRVLVIEDRREVAHLIEEALRGSAECRFEVCWSADLASGLLEAARNRCDAAVLDLSLPDSEGVETVRRFRAERPEIPIVVVTGNEDEDTILECMHSGAQNYLIKGHYVSELLVQAVLSAIRRKQVEDELDRERNRASEYIEIADVMLLALDTGGRVVMVNRKGCEILGCAAAEIVGRDWFETFLPPEARAAVRTVFDTMMRGETEVVEYAENEVADRAGRRRLISWRNAVLKDARGNVTGTLSSGEDVTRKRQIERRLQEMVEQLRCTLEGTVSALGSALERRDPYTAGHERRVAQLACAVAVEMGFSGDDVEGLRVAALLHDVGKIGVPSEILSKPGPLTDAEYELVKAHPRIGHEILSGIEFPWPVARIVLEHHERLDGTGYPKGLRGHELLRESRILAVADVVEAMSSHRPYRSALGVENALDEIHRHRGVRYDGQAADACRRLFETRGYSLEPAIGIGAC